MARKSNKARAAKNGADKLRQSTRIIGGEWRGRKLAFPDVEGLRPTGSRVRETLFNWLQYQIPGSLCLDLFAGSGSLGIEAASRGAKQVTLVEQHPGAVKFLKQNINHLQSENISVEQMSAQDFLQSAKKPFDIVFLDPPFADKILLEVCLLLENGGLVKKNTMIYIEQNKSSMFSEVPKNWRLFKEKIVANVSSHLFVVES